MRRASALALVFLLTACSGAGMALRSVDADAGAIDGGDDAELDADADVDTDAPSDGAFPEDAEAGLVDVGIDALPVDAGSTD